VFAATAAYAAVLVVFVSGNLSTATPDSCFWPASRSFKDSLHTYKNGTADSGGFIDGSYHDQCTCPVYYTSGSIIVNIICNTFTNQFCSFGLGGFQGGSNRSRCRSWGWNSNCTLCNMGMLA
jgi:hypothetical protein